MLTVHRFVISGHSTQPKPRRGNLEHLDKQQSKTHGSGQEAWPHLHHHNLKKIK